MTVTSTGARASALAASRPPKPAPTTTTFGRRATFDVEGLLFSILMVDPRNSARTSRNSRRRLKMHDRSAPGGASLNAGSGRFIAGHPSSIRAVERQLVVLRMGETFLLLHPPHFPNFTKATPRHPITPP